MALDHLGQSAKIASIASPTSEHELVAARWFPKVTRIVLAAHKWHFNYRKSLLVIHNVNDDDAGLNNEWIYAYNRPTSMIRLWEILPEGAPKNRPSEDFELYSKIETGSIVKLILTNLEDAYANYSIDLQDPAEWSDSVEVAVSYLLAMKMANPIIKGKAGLVISDKMQEKYVAALANAASKNKNQSQISEQYRLQEPGWVSNR